ncbi:hypothetical protein CI109_102691 [Kwoniella shandongensis]|uniref:Post-GPI attachment to proteins factor 3 n=1 Tax=Kwoniella shandongensis TaxID=1734106 RepID=A0A5M6BR58_9TREE|nr:uncharacterized protein CI109_007109 [Kwoniella shandongensis]KAA5524562.1 hypothetical protein CI109_007109 [Kwoniella shandongensis]
MPRPSLPFVLGGTLLFLASLPLILASSGDRNPTFQHCLKGCEITYCDPSQPPIAGYLRAFGWTCAENCAYECTHSFTDNIRPGSRYHQFYGKWAFYRFGPFQEPVSILMSLGNLWVNLVGLQDMRRRVRPENRMRPWLVAMGLVQINTWVWSSVFHARDTPTTERLDYFSATLTIAFTLLYSIVRIFGLQTPLTTSRLLIPVSASIAFLVLSHFTYLLSFPRHAFPYGYHTAFNLVLAIVHNILWITWSASFKFRLPTLTFLNTKIEFPKPYPPNDPLSTSISKPKEASTPLSLVFLTTMAMSLELLDFSPILRMVDAHSLWHAATIPITLAWWQFMTNDAIELEGSLLNGARGGGNEKFPLSGGGTGAETMEATPRTPNFAQLAAGSSGFRKSPSPSPKVTKPE